MDVLYGHDKGKGLKGKSWGKGKGIPWGKGKAAYYVEDGSCWNNWIPQMLAIEPALDPEGFAPPKRPATLRASTKPPAQVKIGNRFSPLPQIEEANEDIPINILVGEPHPALKVYTQEAEAKGKTNYSGGSPTCGSVLPSVPQAFAAAACQYPHSGKHVC